MVTTSAELVAALTANPGDQTIYVQRGTYLLDHAIQVPDNTALIGEGTMLYDDSGLPAGFVPESRTVIAAVSGVAGDFVTLGDGASLQGLVIQDVVRPGLIGGSVVVVSSRKPSDSVSVKVAECDIVNPNSLAGPGANGPVGRGLLVQTRNRLSLGGAAPHEQSLVSVHLTQSIIRSPGGGDAIFAINFTSGSRIELHLRRNVIGKLGANGGVSRPDSTVAATTLIQSLGNLYRADSPTPTSIGWQINGGSDAPMIAPLIAEATLNNKLSLHSRLASTTSDLELLGARNGMGMADGNELRVTMHNVIGSGPRANTYRDAVSNLGTGNRLLITGSLNAFSHTNEAIEPLPGAQFFTGGR